MDSPPLRQAAAGRGRHRGQVIQQHAFVNGLIPDGDRTVVPAGVFQLAAETDQFAGGVLVVAAVDGDRGTAVGMQRRGGFFEKPLADGVEDTAGYPEVLAELGDCHGIRGGGIEVDDLAADGRWKCFGNPFIVAAPKLRKISRKSTMTQLGISSSAVQKVMRQDLTPVW